MARNCLRQVQSEARESLSLRGQGQEISLFLLIRIKIINKESVPECISDVKMEMHPKAEKYLFHLEDPWHRLEST